MPKYRFTDPQTGKTITVEGPTPPPENVVRAMFQKANAQPPQDTSGLGDNLQRATGAGPMVGATVGGIVGGVPGAAIGGAAGTGFESLIRSAREIPGAIRDVASNVMEHPRETMSGFVEGAKEGLQDVGIAGAVNAGLEAGGQAAMKGLQKAGAAIYRGYLKPSLAGANVKKAQDIVHTAIEEGLPITNAGVDKAQALIGDLKRHVDQVLQDRNYIGKVLHGDIDLHDIAESVRSFARENYYKAGRPSEDFEAAMKIADNIDAHPSIGVDAARSPQPVSLQEAQNVKRTIDSSLGDRAFGVERSPAQEAEKAGRRALREAIELRAPEVAKLNDREKKLIDAARAIRAAVERDANHNALVGVKTGAAAIFGSEEYARTGDPWTAAAKALGVRLALTPTVASKLAIMTARLGKIPGVAPASAARVALAALSESQAEEK